MKIERTRIHFFSNAFSAVASLKNLKVPILGPTTPDQYTRLGLFGSKCSKNTNSNEFCKVISLN